MEWLRYLYERWQERLVDKGIEIADLEAFWNSEKIETPIVDQNQILFSEFRGDAESNPLSTPSAKIEIYSSTIASFCHSDCPGPPVWIVAEDWLGNSSTYPLQRIANQPKTRLHSQLDTGTTSQNSRIQGREPLRRGGSSGRRST